MIPVFKNTGALTAVPPFVLYLMEQIMRSTAMLLLGICAAISLAGDGTVFGPWRFEPAKSTELSLWRSRVPLIEISGTREALLLRTPWMEGTVPTMIDPLLLRPGGTPSSIPTTSAVWPDNWLMGVLATVGTPQKVSAAWEAEGELRTTSVRTVSIFQSEAMITTVRLLHQIGFTEGFRFRANHNVKPGVRYVPGEKLYIGLIPTDCPALGAWTKPGRGEIPYTWEVTMNWAWLAPGMLQYFYDQKSPSDCFIGSLSGPGYMYSKAIPPSMLPAIVDSAYALMRQLDLDMFEVIDHSAYWHIEGIDDDIPKDVMDVYFGWMPGVLGIANGYRPGHTFAVNKGRPFISYDYYLAEKRDEAEAAADLEELAALNPKRPNFLLMHVRQWSDIRRVQRVLTRLGPQFEVVPVDLMFTMAAENPTFVTRYGDPLPAWMRP